MPTMADRYAARTIAQTLALLRCDGWAQAEIDKLMAELAAHVADHGGNAKGEVTIKLKFNVDRDAVNATAHVDRKRPAPPPRKSMGYLTDEHALTARDPSQHDMFREDAIEARAIVDAD